MTRMEYRRPNQLTKKRLFGTNFDCLIMVLVGVIVVYPSLTTACLAAKSPLGIATPDGVSPDNYGFFWQISGYVRELQSSFYRQLITTITELKQNGQLVWFLLGLSFLYGLLHAAGPGHGKAILSSFVLANHETAKKGIFIAFIAAFTQALTAILLVGGAVYFFNLTGLQIDQHLRAFTISSALLILVIGIAMLYRTIRRLIQNLAQRAADNPNALAHSCGHLPKIEAANHQASLYVTAGAILSVGMRPCTGAVIVLVFCASQNIWLTGVASAMAMAFGVGLMVATIIIMAVLFRTVAISITGSNNHRLITLVVSGIELFAITIVIWLAIMLLVSNL